MSLFLQTLVLRGILFREQEHRQERIGVGMTLWPTGAQTPPSRHPALRTDSPKNEDKMKRTIVIPALLLLAASATAQTTFAQMKDPVGAALRNILPGRQKNTVAAVEAMPADKFNYKPSADQMTFGHLVAHMVETNNLLCSKAAAVPATNVKQVKDTDSKDNLVAALKASFDFCSDALAKMDDSKLGETTEGFGGKQVTRAWLSLVLAGTWADHYAEAAMYLRLNGVLPPTAKK
jgi:uncharacterized damage-inducible protein DinB